MQNAAYKEGSVTFFNFPRKNYCPQYELFTSLFKDASLCWLNMTPWLLRLIGCGASCGFEHMPCLGNQNKTERKGAHATVSSLLWSQPNYWRCCGKGRRRYVLALGRLIPASPSAPLSLPRHRLGPRLHLLQHRLRGGCCNQMCVVKLQTNLVNTVQCT